MLSPRGARMAAPKVARRYHGTSQETRKRSWFGRSRIVRGVEGDSPMNDPKITILICTFNGARTIAAAIESALAQKTQIPFEVFVVDDGSTDETAGIVRHMSEHDQRIWMKHLPRNSGLPLACNDGVKFSDGDYFIRLDDDDLIHPDALESLCPMLNAGLADWSYCDRLARSEE